VWKLFDYPAGRGSEVVAIGWSLKPKGWLKDSYNTYAFPILKYDLEVHSAPRKIFISEGKESIEIIRMS
jgi:hypothetical protein